MDFLVGVGSIAAFAGLVWFVVKGVEYLQKAEHDRETALAWMFLTFSDADVEKMRADLMRDTPHRYAMELRAIARSREMRARLRS